MKRYKILDYPVNAFEKARRSFQAGIATKTIAISCIEILSAKGGPDDKEKLSHTQEDFEIAVTELRFDSEPTENWDFRGIAYRRRGDFGQPAKVELFPRGDSTAYYGRLTLEER